MYTYFESSTKDVAETPILVVVATCNGLGFPLASPPVFAAPSTVLYFLLSLISFLPPFLLSSSNQYLKLQASSHWSCRLFSRSPPSSVSFPYLWQRRRSPLETPLQNSPPFPLREDQNPHLLLLLTRRLPILGLGLLQCSSTTLFSRLPCCYRPADIGRTERTLQTLLLELHL